MYASNALPPPVPFTHEHRPLRLTSESARPQPQGGCHFQQDSRLGQRCLCQTYQHNRTLPGNSCDCGHSACYHSQTNTERRLSPDRIVSALVEKVKKLEDVVIKERETRYSAISRERQAWEREVRVLREALAPFYQNESEMKQRLVQLEGKLDSTYNEQSRLKERVVAIDDAGMSLERRVDSCESYGCLKRKASLTQDVDGVLSPESNYTCSSSSSAASDVISTSTHRSPQSPSPMDLPMPLMSTVSASPRSSGVLDLKPGSRYGHAYQPQSNIVTPSGVDKEARSSGFLSIDLAERLMKHRVNPPATTKAVRETKKSTNPAKARLFSHGVSSPPPTNVSTGALPVSELLSYGVKSDSDNRSPKRHQQYKGGMMALEILANATVEQPAAH